MSELRDAGTLKPDSDAEHQADLTRRAEMFIELLALARKAGATVRTLAKLAHVSKSTMGRWMPGIDAAVSQLGQRDAVSPAISVDGTDAPSQMGHADPATPQGAPK